MDAVKIPIGLAGLNAAGGALGVGKDTFADYLIELCPDMYARYSFAEPIRRIGEVFGFTREQMADRAMKELCDEFWGISPRRFLQMVGTDMFRNVWRSDVWIKCARKAVCGNPGRHTVITDVRYANEMKFIQDMGGLVVRLRRNSEPYADSFHHPSEFELNRLIASGALRPDLEVDNNGSMQDLKRRAFDFHHRLQSFGFNKLNKGGDI